MTEIVAPFQQFFGADGVPLANGMVYIGAANLDAESNPISVFWDDALTIPAAQPIRTLNGYPINNGSPARLYIAQTSFSLTVRNAQGRLIFSVQSISALLPTGSIPVSATAPGSPTTGMLWLDNDTPSATIWTLKQYDGADWIELGRLDTINNIFIPSEGVIAWADVPSAATLDLGAQASRHLRITGNTAISSFGTAASGVRRQLRFAAALTLNHNATSLILPGGAAISVAAGDTATAISLGSGNWVVVDYQRAAALPVLPGAITGSGLTMTTARVLARVTAGSGAIEEIPLANPAAALSFGITRGVELATNTGQVQYDFTGIPAGLRRITILLRGVSISGTDDFLIQIGAGSIVNTGYNAWSMSLRDNAVSLRNQSTAGFIITQDVNSAARAFTGRIFLENMSGNVWVASGSLVATDGVRGAISSGDITLSGALDRFRLTVTGTNTFDAGFVNFLGEF